MPSSRKLVVLLALLLPPIAGGVLARSTRAQGAAAAPTTEDDVFAEWAAASHSTAEAAGGRVQLWCAARARRDRLKRTAEKAVSTFDSYFPREPREEHAPAAHRAVLIELADAEDLASLTRWLGTKYERLSSWASAAAGGVGFALEEPLSAGWLVACPENEVWNPENELVNRLARLLTLERYRRLPNWLEMGLAWQIELAVCKDVFCFPFRTGFVSKKEHRSWDTRLAQVMEARGGRPIEVAELSGWRRGTWDDERAALAWGAVAMLTRHYREELVRLCAAFAEERWAQGREVHADGSWQWIPDYELPPEREAALLADVLGLDPGAELTRFAQNPRSYRRSR